MAGDQTAEDQPQVVASRPSEIPWGSHPWGSHHWGSPGRTRTAFFFVISCSSPRKNSGILEDPGRWKWLKSMAEVAFLEVRRDKAKNDSAFKDWELQASISEFSLLEGNYFIDGFFSVVAWCQERGNICFWQPFWLNDGICLNHLWTCFPQNNSIDWAHPKKVSTNSANKAGQTSSSEVQNILFF